MLEHDTPLDREVETTRGQWFLAFIAPYRSASNSVDGVVLSLIEMSDSKRAEQSLREAVSDRHLTKPADRAALAAILRDHRSVA